MLCDHRQVLPETVLTESTVWVFLPGDSCYLEALITNLQKLYYGLSSSVKNVCGRTPISGDSDTLRTDTCLDSLWNYCDQIQAVVSVDRINL